MKIILVSAFASSPHCTGHQLYSALVNMGHEVVHLDFRVNHRVVNMQIELEKFEPKVDLLIAWKGSSLDPKLIKNLSYPTVLWYPDDLSTTHGANDIMKLGKAFDYVYTPIQENINEYRYRYGIAAKFLPPAVDMELYKYLPDTEKKYDFSFVGNLKGDYYKDRRDVLTRLTVLTNNYFVGNVYGKDYVKIINQTKINVNIGLDWRGTQLRIFEVLACGGKLFTNKTEYTIFLPDVTTFNIHTVEREFETALAAYDEHFCSIDSLATIEYNHKWECRFDDMFNQIKVGKYGANMAIAL